MKITKKFSKNAKKVLTNDVERDIIRMQEVAFMRRRKSGEKMLDVQKLKGKIIEKGKSIETVSADLGINPATFYRKLKNNSFEIREADKLIEVLSLTGEEASAIFFSGFVA